MTVKYGDTLLQDDGFSMIVFGTIDMFEYLRLGSIPAEMELIDEALDSKPRSHG